MLEELRSFGIQSQIWAGLITVDIYDPIEKET